MDELQQWLEVLHAADAKYQEDSNDSQAAADAQYAADKIRSLRNSVSEKPNAQETTSNDISQKITQPIVGLGTAALLGAGKGIGYLQDKRDLSQARAFVQAQQELAAKTPQTGLERQIQGTIDPATGETGRARQTGYNEMTHEQKLARTQVTNPTIKSLIQQGIITGQNPLLGATGHIGSTETGVLAKPEEIVAYKASKATPQVKPPSLMGNVFGSAANTAGKVLKTISPYAAAYGVGSQGFDALERGWQGDYPGAVISALGAGSNFYGVPGIAMGLTLEKANRMRDEFARGERQLPNYENVNPAGDIGYATGGIVNLAEGKSAKKPDESSAAFGYYPQMTPKRATPHGPATVKILEENDVPKFDKGGPTENSNNQSASQMAQKQFSVQGIPLKPSDDESYQSWWTDASKQNDMNRYANAMLPSKDLNISNPSYLKGVESITNYPGGHITGQLGFYKPFIDGSNINVTSDLNEKEAPYVTGHEAQHLQDNLAFFNQWGDEKNYSFLNRLDRGAAKTNSKPYEEQIEKNYQDYVKKWKKEEDENPNKSYYGSSRFRANEELGNYYDRTPGFNERFADFAGLEAALPRGTRLADTPLGKAVFNTPELQNYYNLNVRPLENKAIAGHSPTSPTADGIRKIKAALQYHFNNTGESYADALINGIKDTFKK